MISIPDSLSFAKLVMMTSALTKSADDASYVSQDLFIHLLIDCPIQSRLQTQLGVCSFYVEHKYHKEKHSRSVKTKLNKRARSNWLLSCCDVPANILIVIFFFLYHKGKANKKNKSCDGEADCRMARILRQSPSF